MGQYSHLYNTRRWRAHRAQQLRTHPLCVLCAKEGIVSVATVADHVAPHKGDLELFWRGKLQSLCALCHNKTKQNIEGHGYHSAIGVDGFPVDEMHPVNRKNNFQ